MVVDNSSGHSSIVMMAIMLLLLMMMMMVILFSVSVVVLCVPSQRIQIIVSLLGRESSISSNIVVVTLH